MKYKFSAPMAYKKEFIDKYVQINNEIEQSEITALYFSLPKDSPDMTGFEQNRLYLNEITFFEDWKPLIIYSFEKGFDFIYLLNGPKIFNPEFGKLEEHLEKLDRLLNNLKLLGCNKLRVCSPQLIDYLTQNYPQFELYLSTSKELQSIKQFEIFFSFYKNLKELTLPFDLNKNFIFLRNLKKKYPKIRIEIMVNEGCLPGCPIRNEHNILVTEEYTKESSNYIFSGNYFGTSCRQYCNSHFLEYITKSNIIYPWEFCEYKKLGINNFKLVGRNNPYFQNGEYFEHYKSYLKGIDNFKNIENAKIVHFNNFILNYNFDLTVKEVKHLLPNINHFKKYGHLCASRCGVECRYCYRCAEKIQKVFEKKMKEKEKHANYVPACKINT